MNNKHIVLLVLIAISVIRTSSLVPLPTELLQLGFKATPNPSISSFQPLLNDSTANYSLGFLRVNKNQLSLSVIHLPSSVPLWTANTTRLLSWAHTTQLTFNGSLVLSDTHTGVFWSTRTNADRVYLSNTSNLQLQSQSRRDNGDDIITILWESFQFPSDTLVEGQNFTSAMSLVSSNGFYSMRLGSDFFGLYANFRYPAPGPGQMYLKHGALEAKADIIEGQPLQLILQPEGYLGMYQNGPLPVDVESFNTFQHNLSGIRRLRIEPDGNLNGYYWTGSSWVLDYYAISDPCELPSSCGSYGLCKQGEECSCLDNRKVHGSGGCGESIISDFCGKEEDYGSGFKILRRSGVELPFKESMGYIKMDSLEKCEGACEGNCTCWGVVYSNSSGFCYIIDYPIQSLLAVGDKSKLGYFKVREGVGKQNGGKWLGLGLGLLFGAILVFLGVVGLGWYKLRSTSVKGYLEEDGGVGAVGVGAYKDLNTASFRSIELSEK